MVVAVATVGITAQAADPGATPIEITIDPLGVARRDLVVSADVDVERLAGLAGASAFGEEHVRLIETSRPDASAVACPLQLDFRPVASTGQVRVWLLLSGETAGARPRHFRLEGSAGSLATSCERPGETASVRCDLTAFDAGQAAVRIETPAAEYFYQIEGAAFSSLHDPQGRDWISYRRGDGPQGEFRGIPNMGHPQGYMHPGGRLSHTVVETAGPLLVELYSESRDGTWAGRWQIHPGYAIMTVVRTNGPYWFLYEGTPGGTVEPDDFWIRADGTRGPLAEGWRNHPMDADWVAFADGTADLSLLLVHEANQSIDASYWLMKEAMTVFGFGRREKLQKAIVETPRRFYIALVPSREHTRLAEQAAAFTAPVRIEVK